MKHFTTQPKPGDIIGFTGFHWSSCGICLGTLGLPFISLTHVGILGEHEGELLLFESTTLDDRPCLIQGIPFKGTQAQRLQDRVNSYHGKCWHYPLSRPLFDDERERLNEFLHDTIGIPYDKMGAFRSGAGLSWVESWFRKTDLSSIFCSEWVCAAHTEIGIFRTGNISRWNPKRFVRVERRDGILLDPIRLKRNADPEPRPESHPETSLSNARA